MTGPAHAIVFEFARTAQPEDPFAFCFAQQSYALRTPGGGRSALEVDWSPQRREDLGHIRQLGCDPATVQRVGDWLATFMATAGWHETGKRILEAARDGHAVRIAIRSNAAELYALPWELLTIPGTGQYLGSLAGVSVHYEWPETETVACTPNPRPAGGRILLAFSSAGGPVPDGEHREAIASACAQGDYDFQPERDVLDEASLTAISEKLAAGERAGTPYAALHLLCHGVQIGGSYGLALTREDNPRELDAVDAARLRHILSAHASSLRLVVLAACDSGNTGDFGNQLGSAAQALHRAGFEAVVASRFPLSITGSQALAEALYTSLLVDTNSLETACMHTRATLARDTSNLDWASLQLYTRTRDGGDSRPFVFRPYRGLLAFQPQHARFFYGRQHERHEFSNDIKHLIEANQPRMLVVTGASGSGKSSLVLSGLIPDLLTGHTNRDSPWHVAILRPGLTPLEALDNALRPIEASATSTLIVVDQFEEVFTQVDDPTTRQRFAKRLWSLASDQTRCICIVLTIRVDFLGRCDALLLDDSGLRLDKVAHREAHRVYVGRLTDQQLREAIEGPARRLGLRFEDGLCARLMASFGAQPGALPLLEHTLDQLWQRRDGRVLNLQAYEAIGGVVGALQQQADTLLASLGPDQLRLARRLLTRLVRFDDLHVPTRRRLDEQQARPESAREQAAFEAMLAALVDARLVVRDEHRGGTILEIAHEALIAKWPRLRNWLDEDRTMLSELAKLDAWARQWHEDGTLLSGARLGYACEVLERFETDIPVSIRSLIEKSQRRSYLARAALATTLLAFVVLSLAAIVLWRFAVEHATNETHARIAETQAKQQAQRARQQETEAKQEAQTRARVARDALRVSGARAALQDDRFALAIGLLREVEADNPGADVHGWSHVTTESLSRNGGQLAAFVGHDGAVISVDLVRDATRLVSFSSDGSSRLWDTQTGAILATLRGRQRVYRAAVDPSGTYVVTSYADGQMRVWDTQTGTERNVLTGHSLPPATIAFANDGTRVATGSDDVRVWDLATGQSLAVLKGHHGEVQSVLFGHDDTYVVTGSLDHTAKIWDPTSGRLLASLQTHTAHVGDIAISPDGTLVATASKDATARLWDRVSGAQKFVLYGHTTSVNSVVFCAHGTRLLTTSNNGSLILWDVNTGQAVTNFLSTSRPATAISIHPEGNRIITGHADGTARVWDPTTGSEVGALRDHRGTIRHIQTSPDGQYVAIASADDTVRVWDPAAEVPLALLHGHQAAILAMTFRADGTQLVTASKDHTARLWLGWGQDDTPRRKLWLATRTCPSASERTDQLGIDEASAARDSARCEAMIQCIADEARHYETCLGHFLEAQTQELPFMEPPSP